MNNVSLLRWAGGKGKQLAQLLPLIPRGNIYVEPFGGGCSVLLNTRPYPVEVYNDLDESLVNLFTQVRDNFEAFYEYVGQVLYSRVEYERALQHEDVGDGVVRAALFYASINQSISGKRLARRGDWARGRIDNLASRWQDRLDKLPVVYERIRNVQIECRDALDILREWDTPGTVFYCDPPYVLDTRSQRKYYAVEPGDAYHKELVDVLLGVRSAVVLSGYNHPVYKRLLDKGWWTDEYGAHASMEVTNKGGTKQGRVEIVYRNRKAAAEAIATPLFLDDDLPLS